MKVIKPSYEILTEIDSDKILLGLEAAARTCYKSEDKITENSARELMQQLIDSGHEAMIEFDDITVRFICDRGISHELVRHRIASFAQESTRYCNYSRSKFGNELTFIVPNWLDHENPTDAYDYWAEAMKFAEKHYLHLISDWKWSAQKARSVLPNSLKTEIVMKANIREWRHFFKLRCAPAAHPQMRELTIPLLHEIQSKIPVLFDDINY